MFESKDLPTLPERLNLSISKGCFVSCPGCYSYFGNAEPDLTSILESVSQFVKLGIQDVTISGGDPLTISGILRFLQDLRQVGVRCIKLDTVGTGLVDSTSSHPIVRLKNKLSLTNLLEKIDFLAIPLDGWSEHSVSLFRSGRPHLYQETIDLLNALDLAVPEATVVINTVAHSMNLDGLPLIWNRVLRHPSVCHWNVFQYSPTDQVAPAINQAYSISDQAFANAYKDWLTCMAKETSISSRICTEFRSTHSRLGRYLLINSDGVAWMPDEYGLTIKLGSIFGREDQVLQEWNTKTVQISRLFNLHNDKGSCSVSLS